MAIIKTKVPTFNGYRASVLFKNGVGQTNDTRLIEWFRTHGYTVEDVVDVKPKDEKVDDEPVNDIEHMNFTELKKVAKTRGVAIGNIKDKEKLIAKLKEVM